MRRVIGYVRVSTEEQGHSRAGLEAQRAAIRSMADIRGWELVEMYEDIASGKSTNGRHGLEAALRHVEDGAAEALVCAKLDRLSRSVLDFATLLDRARRGGWAVVVLDVGLDLSDPMGEAMANMVATFAQLERRLIGQRTKAALAVKRAQGVRLGRPPALPVLVRERIRSERDAGTTYAAIAAELNATGVPTAQGGRRWYPSSVRAADLARA